jgi:hypothetical protein
MMVGLMYPNGLVWRRVNYDNKKEDQMVLSLMYAVEAEKRARQEKERRAEAEQGWAPRVPAPAGKAARSKVEAQRKPRGAGKLVAAMGGIGW